MKRYENMTKEEVIDALNKPHELPDGVCKGCAVFDWDTENNHCNHRCVNGEKGTCDSIVRRFLNEEINVVPRWKTIRCNEDVHRMLDEWYLKSSDSSVAKYLCENVEIL